METIKERLAAKDNTNFAPVDFNRGAEGATREDDGIRRKRGSEENDGSDASGGTSTESDESPEYEIEFTDTQPSRPGTGLFFMDETEGPGPFERPLVPAEYVPKELAEKVECPVCFNVLENPVALPCTGKHLVCLPCAKILTKLALGTSQRHADTSVAVKCPLCSEAVELPIDPADAESFFAKPAPDASATEFVESLLKGQKVPLVCTKHKGDFSFYDVNRRVPLCSKCASEKGAEEGERELPGFVLPMKTCSGILRHSVDALCSSSLEFENMCEGHIDSLNQTGALVEKNASSIESAIKAEADFLHKIVDRKRSALIYKAHVTGKQRRKTQK